MKKFLTIFVIFLLAPVIIILGLAILGIGTLVIDLAWSLFSEAIIFIGVIVLIVIGVKLLKKYVFKD